MIKKFLIFGALYLHQVNGIAEDVQINIKKSDNPIRNHEDFKDVKEKIYAVFLGPNAQMWTGTDVTSRHFKLPKGNYEYYYKYTVFFKDSQPEHAPACRKGVFFDAPVNKKSTKAQAELEQVKQMVEVLNFGILTKQWVQLEVIPIEYDEEVDVNGVKKKVKNDHDWCRVIQAYIMPK